MQAIVLHPSQSEYTTLKFITVNASFHLYTCVLAFIYVYVQCRVYVCVCVCVRVSVADLGILKGGASCGGSGGILPAGKILKFMTFSMPFCPESMSVSSYQESYKCKCGLLTASI